MFTFHLPEVPSASESNRNYFLVTHFQEIQLNSASFPSTQNTTLCDMGRRRNLAQISGYNCTFQLPELYIGFLQKSPTDDFELCSIIFSLPLLTPFLSSFSLSSSPPVSLLLSSPLFPSPSSPPLSFPLPPLLPSLSSSFQDVDGIETGSVPLGHLAPPWLPDSSVSMCQLCSVQFTVTRRRHHCRACGMVSKYVC